MYMQNIETMSLFELLCLHKSRQPNHNYYVMALAKSRQQQINQQLLNLLYEIYMQQGDKWLDVVRRLLKNNFERGIIIAFKTFHFYRPIIAEIYDCGSTEHLLYLKNSIESMIVDISNESDLNSKIIKTETFTFHISMAFDKQNWQMLHQIIQFICCHPQILLECASSIYPEQQEWLNQLTHECRQRIEKHSVEFIKQCAYLQTRLEYKCIKHLNMLKVFQKTEPLQIFLYDMFVKTLPKMLSTKLSFYVEGKANQTLSYSDLNYLYDLCSDIIKSMSCISLSCSMETRLAFIFHENPGKNNNETHLPEFLLNVFLSTDLLYLNRCNDISEELIRLNNQLITHRFSDTLTGQMCRFIATLCSNFGNFLEQYIEKLLSIFKNQIVSYNNKAQIGIYNLLFKLSIPSQILLKRDDIIEELIPAILNQYFTNLQTGQTHFQLSQLDQLQLLLFMTIFSQKLNQKAILFVYKLCLNTMKKVYFDGNLSQKNSRVQPKNFIFQQSYDLLVEMTHKDHVSRILVTNLGQMIDQLLMLPLYPPSQAYNPVQIPIQFYKVHHRFISSFKQLISRSSHQLLEQLNRAFNYQINKLWHSHKKISQAMTQILGSILLIVKDETEQQISFEAISQFIVPILSYLSDPYKIQFEDQLLEILGQLLKKQKYLTSDICLVLGKIERLVDKNEGKLSILSRIYYSLGIDSKIVEQISFQYKQIVQLFLIMFEKYLQQFQIQEYMFYKLPVKQLFDSFQLFVHGFQQIIIQTFMPILNQIFYVLEKIVATKLQIDSPAGELRYEFRQIIIQTMMVICHSCPNQSLLMNLFNLLVCSHFKQHVSIKTLNLIPISLTDILLHNTQFYEKIIPQILEFYTKQRGITKIYQDNRYEVSLLINQNKAFNRIKIQKIWGVKLKDYIENAFRELRNRKVISQLEHIEYLEQIAKIYI